MRSAIPYGPGIDRLRAVAALPVIPHGAGRHAVPSGFLGADTCFVTGGYLVTGIIAGALAEGRFSLGLSHERRAPHRLPSLAPVMTACAPAALLLMTSSQVEYDAREGACLALSDGLDKAIWDYGHLTLWRASQAAVRAP